MGTKELQDLGMDPDAIRIKLDQIMEWNDLPTDTEKKPSRYIESGLKMNRFLLIIFLVSILTSCTKYRCVSDTGCKKVIDWNSPGASIMRSIITNGASAGSKA